MTAAAPGVAAVTGSHVDDALAHSAEAIVRLPKSATILLACHVNPDGDALGSMLAFGLGLRRLGYAGVRASFPEPFTVPQPFDFLPGLDLLVPPSAVPDRPDLGVSFDAASPGRLGELVPALEAASTWIVVDHHASNPGFGTLPLIDPSAAATAVVAARLLDRLDVAIDADIATGLYVGIVTDSGSFRLDTTSAELLSLAARLVRAGADPAGVARRVFDTRPYAAVRLLAEVLGRAYLDPQAAGGQGLVTAYATEDDLRRHRQPAPILESFIDVLRTTAEADVACLVKPAGRAAWSVSLRSRGGTDVAAVAAAMGGGGHRSAAGFTAYGEVTEVLAAVRSALG